MVLLMLMLTGAVTLPRVYSQQYFKPSFPDYAPSGMPDFDEKQDNWGPVPGTFTWCVPVAVADSMWWLDSEYESKYFQNPVPPPTISDHFNLVTSYNSTWDDHDSRNVDPLVRNLAFLMDTDGQRTGSLHVGTRWVDVQPGINAYLQQQGVNGSFEVHGTDYPNYTWINAQILQCQAVELFLEFYYFTGGGWINMTNPNFESGHCVACAGTDNVTLVFISDPYYDISNPAPTNHNDAQFVSHDAYIVAPSVLPPPLGYPPAASELQNYLQIVGFTADPNWHTFIRGAVATSPVPMHDVRVTNVTTAKTGCTPVPTIAQNFNVTVNVTVANTGSYDESSVNITAFATPTPSPSVTIGTTNVSLSVGANITVTFVWNATSSYGNYTISGAAGPVPGETNTGDNTLSDGNVVITIPGDINGDYTVSLSDLQILAKAYSTTPGNPKWCPNADINCDGKVSLSDLQILAKNYKKSVKPP
jgi:hypothetical protein